MTTREPSTITTLMERLEGVATNSRRLFMLNSADAQVMLDEIRNLKANQAHQLEMPERMIEVASPLPGNGVFGGTVLYSQARVNGRKFVARVVVDEYVWNMYPKDVHAHVKAELRRRLVEGILEEFDPAVVQDRGWRRDGDCAPPAMNFRS